MALSKNPKLDRVLSRMSDMEHQTPTKDFIGLFYGPPGVGKTTMAMALAQRLAQGRKILFADTADGWVSLQNIPTLMENVTRLQIESPGDMPTIAAALKLPNAKRPEQLKDVAVVLVDELSSLANSSLDTLLRERLGTADDEVPDTVPEWSDYFPQKEIIRKVALALQEVEGVHVIFTAHAKEKLDHRKVKVMKPDFPDKLLGELEKIMHVTAFCTAETSMKAGDLVYTRQVQSQPTALIEAKSRIGGLGWKVSGRDFVHGVAEWIESGRISEEADLPESEEIFPDELPTDGIPLSDDNEDEDGAIEVVLASE